jgi:hypothetical protein
MMGSTADTTGSGWRFLVSAITCDSSAHGGWLLLDSAGIRCASVALQDGVGCSDPPHFRGLPLPRAYARTTVRSPRKFDHCLTLTSDQYNILTPRLLVWSGGSLNWQFPHPHILPLAPRTGWAPPPEAAAASATCAAYACMARRCSMTLTRGLGAGLVWSLDAGGQRDALAARFSSLSAPAQPRERERERDNA